MSNPTHHRGGAIHKPKSVSFRHDCWPSKMCLAATIFGSQESLREIHSGYWPCPSDCSHALTTIHPRRSIQLFEPTRPSQAGECDPTPGHFCELHTRLGTTRLSACIIFYVCRSEHSDATMDQSGWGRTCNFLLKNMLVDRRYSRDQHCVFHLVEHRRLFAKMRVLVSLDFPIRTRTRASSAGPPL